ncbi:hypothetical protein QOZ89_08155 [Pseudofrankia sp. BMG5.37]|nr:hypothetical protein [Pseudofrankia sp. BMG5.37]
MKERHVVLDDSAMVAAGRGSIAASTLIHYAHHTPGWFLYAPTCALVEAERVRRGIAEHFASMKGIRVLDLDLPAALAVARETSWATAHARFAAEPDAERNAGAAIATADPTRWRGQSIEILNVRSDQPPP